MFHATRGKNPRAGHADDVRHNGTFIDARRCNDVGECLCTYEVAVRYDRKEGLQERIRETQKREGWRMRGRRVRIHW